MDLLRLLCSRRNTEHANAHKRWHEYQSDIVHLNKLMINAPGRLREKLLLIWKPRSDWCFFIAFFFLGCGHGRFPDRKILWIVINLEYIICSLEYQISTFVTSWQVAHPWVQCHQSVKVLVKVSIYRSTVPSTSAGYIYTRLPSQIVRVHV